MGTVNIRKLKAKLTELGLNVEALGKMIGYDRSSIYRRFADNGAAMTIDDANKIIKALRLTADEAVAIFFGQLVPNFGISEG